MTSSGHSRFQAHVVFQEVRVLLWFPAAPANVRLLQGFRTATLDRT